MSDPKQPMHVPVIASDGGNYSDPGKRWDATPIIVAPNLGTLSAGFKPGTGSWFTAQTANFMFNAWSAHLDAIVDAGTFERHSPAAYNPGNNQLSNLGDTANGNSNGTTDPPLLFVCADDYLIVQQANPSSGSGSGRPAFAYTREGQGLQNAGSSDTNAFLIPSFTGGTSLTTAESGHPCLLATDRASQSVLACGASRATVFSTDRGENWSAGQSLPTDANWQHPTAACVMNGVWYVTDYCPTPARLTRLNHTTDPAAVAWTSVAGTTDSVKIRRMIPGGVNHDTILMLSESNTTVNVWHVGDTSITQVSLTGSGDSSRTAWRGAWNDQIGLFMIGNAEGDAWSSPDGTTWTQVYTNDAGLVMRDIVAHGRGFVISNSATEWAVEAMTVDGPTGAWVRRRLLSAYQGNAGPVDAFHLTSVGGRWVAARVIKNTTWELEWYYGGVNAYDRNNYFGR